MSALIGVRDGVGVGNIAIPRRALGLPRRRGQRLTPRWPQCPHGGPSGSGLASLGESSCLTA